MTKVQQTVYLISERQREALIGYLQNRPFREVAVAIQFLTNAPSAIVNVDVPNDQQLPVDLPQESLIANDVGIEPASVTP